MSTYAITGATGQLGHLAVEELLTRGVRASDLVAIVRTPPKATDLVDRGVRVREGDYSRPDMLSAALTGVDRVLLVSSSTAGQRVADHANVIAAARATGVSRIVYTSMLKADVSGNPLAGEHRATEADLAGSGVPFTVLRNGWYTENYTEQISGYLERGEIVGAAGHGRISGATRGDLAAAAGVALLQDEPGNRIYELGGPSFDLVELAAAITEVTETAMRYRDLGAEAYAAALVQETGMDAETAGFVAALDASLAAGDLESTSRDLDELLGRPATPLRTAIKAARADQR